MPLLDFNYSGQSSRFWITSSCLLAHFLVCYSSQQLFSLSYSISRCKLLFSLSLQLPAVAHFAPSTWTPAAIGILFLSCGEILDRFRKVEWMKEKRAWKVVRYRRSLCVAKLEVGQDISSCFHRLHKSVTTDTHTSLLLWHSPWKAGHHHSHICPRDLNAKEELMMVL